MLSWVLWKSYFVHRERDERKLREECLASLRYAVG